MASLSSDRRNASPPLVDVDGVDDEEEEDAVDADDAANETCLSFFRKLGSISFSRNLKIVFLRFLRTLIQKKKTKIKKNNDY